MASLRQPSSVSHSPVLAEQQRLEEDAQRQRHWKRCKGTANLVGLEHPFVRVDGDGVSAVEAIQRYAP